MIKYISKKKNTELENYLSSPLKYFSNFFCIFPKNFVFFRSLRTIYLLVSHLMPDSDPRVNTEAADGGRSTKSVNFPFVEGHWLLNTHIFVSYLIWVNTWAGDTGISTEGQISPFPIFWYSSSDIWVNSESIIHKSYSVENSCCYFSRKWLLPPRTMNTTTNIQQPNLSLHQNNQKAK